MIAAGVFLAILALLPGTLRALRRSQRNKGGMAGAVLSIGLAFATVFDPALSEAMEAIETNADKQEEDESGGPKNGRQPEAGDAAAAP
ncbi:MAG: hypothetical protein BGO08_06430 [Altererythrobacter sp. 66-12]|nr:MAG: hypothetical protein BGO08_06430 [Altererythrobacter sp. 66-12]